MKVVSFVTPVLMSIICLSGCVSGQMAHLDSEIAYRETMQRHLEEFEKHHPNETQFKMSASAREMIEYQLRDNSPPETRQTLYRLIEQGITEDAAKDYIAQAFQIHLYDLLKLGKVDSLSHYCANLKRLPAKPK